MHGSTSRQYLIDNDDDDDDDHDDDDNDNDDNDDEDDKDDNICKSVNFKVRTSKFCLEIHLDKI